MSKMDTVRFFQVKPAIHYGIGAISEIGENNFERVCIVTDEGMVKFGLLKMVTDVLDAKGIKYHVFSDVEPDPSTEIVEKGLTHILMEKPDALIALGGGSSIDSAKAIIYYCYHFKEMFFGKEYIKKPYFIALPTTAGTGSEVTEYAVITDKKNNTKIPLTDTLMMPDAAILDPKLIESVPAGATAATGMDVLTHAIESYVSTSNNPFSRCYSAKAAELVFKSLYKCYKDGHDLEAKASMQIASCMAGIAFNSGGLGITHSLAHAIGAQWHIPHGLANAIVMPYVVAFNGRNERADYLYSRLLHSMGRLIDDGKTAPETFVRMIFELSASMNIPLTLKEKGIEAADYQGARDTILKKAMADVCTTTNPVQPTIEELGAVLDMVYGGCHS
ncbi:MAG: iron-containing alcohol dehydrogenase [Eubacteriaceae bacterium]|nr:iron-containing alcohol dehydrogenase [Eubacteriaceae bacterium]MDD4507640.1 iron-containing alcohol dehydrogenase [Eubacteriaceae bacterium]